MTVHCLLRFFFIHLSSLSLRFDHSSLFPPSLHSALRARSCLRTRYWRTHCARARRSWRRWRARRTTMRYATMCAPAAAAAAATAAAAAAAAAAPPLQAPLRTRASPSSVCARPAARTLSLRHPAWPTPCSRALSLLCSVLASGTRGRGACSQGDITVWRRLDALPDRGALRLPAVRQVQAAFQGGSEGMRRGRCRSGRRRGGSRRYPLRCLPEQREGELPEAWQRIHRVEGACARSHGCCAPLSDSCAFTLVLHTALTFTRVLLDSFTLVWAVPLLLR